ncbi:outer membrane beta-barrel protein, partial [Mesorhizobium sp. M7A.F.Ca.CA.002.07.1.1]
RGTIIGLTGRTTVEPTTTSGESGDILYSGRLTGERQIRANLTANAALGLDWRDYIGIDGHDRVLSAEAGLTWWLNRYAGLTTRVRSEKLTSNLPGRDYTANSIFLGVKVQR